MAVEIPNARIAKERLLDYCTLNKIDVKIRGGDIRCYLTIHDHIIRRTHQEADESLYRGMLEDLKNFIENDVPRLRETRE